LIGEEGLKHLSVSGKAAVEMMFNAGHTDPKYYEKMA
jgi:hypothetical protein